MPPALGFQAANDLMHSGGKVDLQIAELLHDGGATHPCPQTKEDGKASHDHGQCKAPAELEPLLYPGGHDG